MPEINFRVRATCTDVLPVRGDLPLDPHCDEDRIWAYQPSGKLHMQAARFVDNPHHTSQLVLDYFRTPHDTYFPPVAYAVLHGARLVGNWLLLDQHGQHFPELIPHYVADQFKARPDTPDDGECGRVSFDEVRHVPGDSFLLGMGAAHISHFFYEALVTTQPFVGTDIRFIYGVPPWDAFHQLFELLGFTRGNALEKTWQHDTWGRLHDAECWTFDRLIVPYYTARICPIHLELFRAMRLGIEPASDQLIYVSRQDARRCRVMLNEDEVADMLAGKGFRVLRFSELDERQKIAAVLGAKVMVQPNGAANFYSAFCDQSLGMHVVLNGGGYCTSHARLLASMADFPHGIFLGPDFMSYDVNGHKGENSDFVIDVTKLERRIDEVLREAA